VHYSWSSVAVLPGQCDFGSNCRFSHMTEQDLEKLSAQVQGEPWNKKMPGGVSEEGAGAAEWAAGGHVRCCAVRVCGPVLSVNVAAPSCHSWLPEPRGCL